VDHTAEQSSELATSEKLADDDFKSLSDDEIGALLRATWEYEAHEPLEVLGRITRTITKLGKMIYLLVDLRNPKNGALLHNPYERPGLRQGMFVHRSDAERLPVDVSQEPWVKAQAVLSPQEEREKQGNPFALTAAQGTLRAFAAMPEDWSVETLELNGRSYLENTVLSILRQQYSGTLEAERQTLEEKNREIARDIELLEEASAALRSCVEAARTERDTLAADITVVTDELRLAEHRYQSSVSALEGQLAQLRVFAEKRARELLALDLIDEASLQSLIGAPLAPVRTPGHDFDSVLGGDVIQVAQYVQAYLHNKGIFYSQSLLADFLALLRTNDLIVLAGDSGSGKTNLVKSFAESIGGKAIIIPVKPNWSSSEDLLGYYNPIERRYLPTPFLQALIEAGRNPGIPYLICLDEMNLARVEYYFADFLSLLEERNQSPEIQLYASAEHAHALSEYKTFLSLVQKATSQHGHDDPVSFIDLLKNKQMNEELRALCGFGGDESLLKYHAHLRRSLGNIIDSPSTLRFPDNVRIIGAINVDDTTHYLSPKILDRAHIIRFESPLLQDWEAMEQELSPFDLDLTQPLQLPIVHLGERAPYPPIDRDDDLAKFIITLTRDYLAELGIEVGLRTLRQATNYAGALKQLGANDALIKNNFVVHKILPKLMFDGHKIGRSGRSRKDILKDMRDYLANEFSKDALGWRSAYCVEGLDRVLELAQANDGIVNYWAT
jgi:MoxR-like ATPase